MNDPIELKFARYFAATKHADQKYSGGLPYTHHLQKVEEVLRRFGIGELVPQWIGHACDEHEEQGECFVCLDLLVAAWLHDVVEDTGTKLKEIREAFGDEVARLVEAVTNEKGENRKARGLATYPKIRAAGKEAIMLKLADRIANVEAGGSMIDTYKKEYEDFRRALYPSGELDQYENKIYKAMWNHLDELLGYKPC